MTISLINMKGTRKDCNFPIKQHRRISETNIKIYNQSITKLLKKKKNEKTNQSKAEEKNLRWLSLRGAVKAVPEICSAQRPQGQTRGLFCPLGRAPGIASDEKWFPKPVWYSAASGGGHPPPPPFTGVASFFSITATFPPNQAHTDASPTALWRRRYIYIYIYGSGEKFGGAKLEE